MAAITLTPASRSSISARFGAQGHAANESVPIDEMVAAAEIQLEVVSRLLS